MADGDAINLRVVRGDGAHTFSTRNVRQQDRPGFCSMSERVPEACQVICALGELVYAFACPNVVDDAKWSGGRYDEVPPFATEAQATRVAQRELVDDFILP